jgi:hypothetical protein
MRTLAASFVVACVSVSAAAGCSSQTAGGTPARTSAGAPKPAAVANPNALIPGIGATRASWDASHTRNAADGNGSYYGDDPSLPTYLTDNGAVYRDVDDLGTGRILGYSIAMHAVDLPGVLRQLRQELPSDATIAWDLPRDRCYRVAFNSPTLAAAGRYMAEAQLQYIQEDGAAAPSPDRFNLASIWLEDAGSQPDPAKGC